MTDRPKYYDIRSEFWQTHFGMAVPWDDYLADSDPVHAGKWVAMQAALTSLSPESARRLSDHERHLKILFYSGVWCGDCVRQGPLLKQIADAAGSNVDLRFIDRDLSPELRDELRLLGAMRVPVVVFLSEDYHEVGRFGDRLHTVYRTKLEREQGAACSTGLVSPQADELNSERGEWVDIVERMLIMLRLAPPLRARYDD
ncbi:MAG: thiol reductase thioredoxin [bacterium]|nr:thiol reductase thioredoxin [bacterium]